MRPLSFFFKKWTVSFINRKRYKLVLQAEGGFRARVQFELCGLPTSNYYARPPPRSTRRLPLFMELPRQDCVGYRGAGPRRIEYAGSFRVLTDELF